MIACGGKSVEYAVAADIHQLGADCQRRIASCRVAYRQRVCRPGLVFTIDISQCHIRRVQVGGGARVSSQHRRIQQQAAPGTEIHAAIDCDHIRAFEFNLVEPAGL